MSDIPSVKTGHFTTYLFKTVEALKKTKSFTVLQTKKRQPASVKNFWKMYIQLMLYSSYGYYQWSYCMDR